MAPLRALVALIVVIVAATSKPAIGFSGRHLALLVCLAVFVVGILAWPVLRSEDPVKRAGELLFMGASAVAIVVLQPGGVAELPASAVVFIAGIGLTPLYAGAVGGAVTLGIVVALALAGNTGVGGVAAAALLCAVLGLTGTLLRRYRLSQERAELLLAELEEARDGEARAAAAEERASIARELHDVLAHSLSGLSIQLEAARKIAENAGAPPELRGAIQSAADLAKEGLVEARAAVGALRREEQPRLDNLPELIEHFHRDFHLEVDFVVRGVARPVSDDVGLALYRVVGEALTNVARHALGARTRVEVSFGVSEVRLVVRDEGGESSGLALGGGWGLAGVRERIERLGGDLVAGPAGSGWSVSVRVPS